MAFEVFVRRSAGRALIKDLPAQNPMVCALLLAAGRFEARGSMSRQFAVHQ